MTPSKMARTLAMGATVVLSVAMAPLVAGIQQVPLAARPRHQPPGPAEPIRVLNTVHTDPRLIDLTVSTPALGKPVHVAVLLPTDYDQHPHRRYPVTYFLHGGSAGPNTGLEYLSWLVAGDVEQATANEPVIAVLPQADTGGWYTDWFNGGKGGPPQWETFHIDQLVPFIDHTFRTIPDRGRRALIGLSMGGYGVMEYASRHPDVFGTAASFSGAVDIANPPEVVGPRASLIIGIMAVGDGGTADAPFGSFTGDQINWRDHDPADLIANLHNTNLYLYTGNGQPGPLDAPATVTSGTDFIENVVYQSTSVFALFLAQAHVPAFVDSYGPGTHSWAYWIRDLHDVLPRIMDNLEHPSPLPRTITYTTADPRYTRWGWNVSMDRPAEEFSTLSHAGRAGFQLSGSGSGTVTTPRLYRPRGRHTVTIDGAGIHRVEHLRSDRQGRLTLVVPLGPGNRYPEYTAQAQAAGGTHVFTSSVRVTDRRGDRD